jgi:hypothetical protein
MTSVLAVYAFTVSGVFAASVNNLIVATPSGPLETLTSETGPVSYSGTNVGWPGISTSVAGVADFGVVKARSEGSAIGVYVDTSFQLFVNASPSSSGGGLEIGEPVSLSLSFRLDGLLQNNLVGDGGAFFDAQLLVESPGNASTAINCDIGSMACSGERILDFNAAAQLINGNLSGGWSREYIDDSNYDLLMESVNYSDNLSTFNFDTGILSTTIHAPIGGVVDVFGSLSVVSDMNSVVDFYNTFGLVITPITEGVELDYGDITPATYDFGATVPVPAAVWLFGSGLIGLIGLARRKKS